MTTLSVKQTIGVDDLNKWEYNNADSQNSLTIFDQPKFKVLREYLIFIRDDPYYFLAIILTSIAVFLFIITYLISKNLNTQIQKESFSLGQKVSSLSTGVVSTDQLRAAEERLRILEKDADEIRLLAMQSTQRELLRYDIFSELDPTVSISASTFQLFGQRFRGGIDGLIARVNGGDCLTEAEINQCLESTLLYRRRKGSIDTTYSKGPMKNVNRSNMSRLGHTIVDEICKERAKSVSVYVSLDDLSGYNYWADNKYEGKEKAIRDCWYHQLSYWIIEDVFDTIHSINSSYDNVLTAPVKRLSSITFNMGLKRPSNSGRVHTGSKRRIQSKENGTDRPAYVLSAKDGLTKSHTGRYCDDNIDIIHFNISCIMSAEAVLPFMKELCTGKEHKFSGFNGNESEQLFKHNQITILQSSIKVIDPRDGRHRFYRYGNRPIVELNLVCEYVFYKKGYDEVKPAFIKIELQTA